MTQLGNGLSSAGNNEDALSVKETEFAMCRRLGASEENILIMQANLATIYARLGRPEDAMRIERDVYSGRVKLYGEESPEALGAANNYAGALTDLQYYAQAKPLLRKAIPVARRVLGEDHELTLSMRCNYARALCGDTGATLDDLREAVTTLEETERIARRVFGSAHPFTSNIEVSLRQSRAALRARETPSGRSA